MRRAWVWCCVVALAVFCLVPSATAASVPTPQGPALTVPRGAVMSALRCTGDLASGPAPVLFLPGTTSTATANWSWNWDRALDQRRWAHCNLDLPDSAQGDIQTAAEYVTTAIRFMRGKAGRKISIVGHSQGGMLGRWALKYWPDTRQMVDDYVGLASSNHGTAIFSVQCGLTRFCAPANWQQATGSKFLTALNAGTETYPGISYTEIATRYDEIVVPYTSVFLNGPASQVTNTTVQNLCPLEVEEHFGMAYSNGAWLIGLDALTHPGPAKVARVSRHTCGSLTMPGVNLLNFPTNLVAALGQTATAIVTAKTTPSEPPLRSYAR